MSILTAPKKNFGSLLKRKSGFILKVYMLLIFQIVITASVVTWLRMNQKINEKVHKFWFIWFILTLITILVLGFVRNLPLPVRLLLLTIFSILIGLNCIAASKKVTPEAIKAGLIGAAGIFIVFTIIGGALLAYGIDLSFLWFTLFAVLTGVVITLIVMMFVPVSNTVHKIVLGVILVLFSVFVAFDTNIMLQRNYKDFIDAAINLYLDVLNLFTAIVSLESE